MKINSNVKMVNLRLDQEFKFSVTYNWDKITYSDKHMFSDYLMELNIR